MLLRKQLPVTVYIVFLLLILAIIFTPVFYRAAEFGDYIAHYTFAKSIENGEQLRIPHVLYHILVIVLKNTLGSDDQVEATAILSLSIRLLFGIILFWAIKSQLPHDTPNILIVLSVVLLLLMAPIYLQTNALSFPPSFLGYINYLPYHSPTQHLMLLFAVPVSLVALRAVSPKPFKSLNQRIFFTLFSAVLVLYLSLSKPNYSIIILPAMGLVVLYRLVRRLPVDWLLLIVGVGIPFVLMLGMQYLVAYSDPTHAGVGIGWMHFFRSLGFRPQDIILRLGLSAVLPLTVYILYFREARRDDYLNFSWLVFGVSLACSFLLYERGQRAPHGNFVWSSYASMFIVMCSTVLFLLKLYTSKLFIKPVQRTALVVTAILAHVYFGIFATHEVATLDLETYRGRIVLDCGHNTFISSQFLSAHGRLLICP